MESMEELFLSLEIYTLIYGKFRARVLTENLTGFQLSSLQKHL